MFTGSRNWLVCIRPVWDERGTKTRAWTEEEESEDPLIRARKGSSYGGSRRKVRNMTGDDVCYPIYCNHD